MTIGKWHWPRRGKIAAALFVAVQIAVVIYSRIVEARAKAEFDATMVDAKEDGALVEMGTFFVGVLHQSTVGLEVLPYWAVVSGLLIVVMLIYYPRKLRA